MATLGAIAGLHARQNGSYEWAGIAGAAAATGDAHDLSPASPALLEPNLLTNMSATHDWSQADGKISYLVSKIFRRSDPASGR